jgi:hypothetical protein
MEIFINKSEIQNDKFVEVFVCWDFEYETGYDIYVTYTNEKEIPDYDQSKYRDYFQLVANKVTTVEKAVHIAKVFAEQNGLVYGGDKSPAKIEK